ncbi:unnamed protein product [Rhodiola kirilowii]
MAVAVIDSILAFPFSSKHPASALKPCNSTIQFSSGNHLLSLSTNYTTTTTTTTRRRSRSRAESVLVSACLSSPSSLTNPSTKLYVSGLSFRTTEDGLRTAFQSFGRLVEVNLVMDKIANRPRGFAFLRYATEEESNKAIEGMHGKFLDGRVIFVEVAKPRSELRKNYANQNPRLHQ